MNMNKNNMNKNINKNLSLPKKNLILAPKSFVSTEKVQTDNISKKRLRGKKLKNYKETLMLTDTQIQNCVGHALGDGNFQTRDGGKTYRMKFGYGDINKDYAHWFIKN
uniref:hypothetical protein n=1 Tax=Hydrocytium acuminatum TaxID=1745963 RepID=UPI002A7ECF54|nr:hypothetical protein UYM18_pgp098 [Hydrocytium acuminatum]WOR09521.1 hypothetical protein [Hydrocytium acuminatum]